MASEQGRPAEQPSASGTERALVVAFLVVCAALVVVIATFALWSGADAHRALLEGLQSGALAVALIVSSARTFFFGAARSRRPRRRRAFAVVSALVGVYLVVHALRGI